MVNFVGNILGPALQGQLTALQRTARAMDSVQLQLATGRRVNSAIDDPQNFFASLSLKNKAKDLARLLDGIGQSIRTIQGAEAGVRGVTNIIENADAFAFEARSVLAGGSITPLSEIILEDEPIAYWQLNETTGTTAVNQGTAGAAIDGTYINGVTLGQEELFPPGEVTAYFDGSNNQRVNIPDSLLINTDPAGYPERTIELVFNADSVAGGKQVLYEEGGTINAISIYVDSGQVHVETRDAGDFGPFGISAAIEAGKSYHVALTLDDANGVFRGFLNGEQIGTGVVTKPLNRHTADIAIGAMRGGSFFHDGSQGGNGLEFVGQISDVAIYNEVLTQQDIQERYDATLLAEAERFEDEVRAIIEQLDLLVEDTHYRGVNLLDNEDLLTVLDRDRSSDLLTEGTDFTSSGLNLTEIDFRNLNRVDLYLDDVREALKEVRLFGQTLSNDLSIIQARETFTNKSINTHESGSDDLTILDQNDAGASFLALQVRQEIQFSVLAFGNVGFTEFLLSSITSQS